MAGAGCTRRGYLAGDQHLTMAFMGALDSAGTFILGTRELVSAVAPSIAAHPCIAVVIIAAGMQPLGIEAGTTVEAFGAATMAGTTVEAFGAAGVAGASVKFVMPAKRRLA